MRQYRQCFTFISITTGMLFISAYISTFFLGAEALSQSQSTTTVCNGEESSCRTVTCLQGRTCYTYQFQPSPTFTQQSSDLNTVQQLPNGDSRYLQPQPLEGGTDFQPLEEEAGTTLAD
jgi:hypothetical protein